MGLVVSLPDAAGEAPFVVARAGLVALGRGGDASGGASETGGVDEACPFALSCGQVPTNMKPRARSVARRIYVLPKSWVPRLKGMAGRATT